MQWTPLAKCRHSVPTGTGDVTYSNVCWGITALSMPYKLLCTMLH
jgi:hypothetical protein